AAAIFALLIHLILGEQEHTERFQSGVAERQLIALVVLPEPAGAAGPGGEVHILIIDLLGADALGLRAEEVDEVPGCKTGRATLADVGHLATGEQIVLGCHRQDAAAIATVLEYRLEHFFQAPMEASEQNRDRVPFGAWKRFRTIGPVMLNRRRHGGLLLRCMVREMPVHPGLQEWRLF